MDAPTPSSRSRDRIISKNMIHRRGDSAAPWAIPLLASKHGWLRPSAFLKASHPVLTQFVLPLSTCMKNSTVPSSTPRRRRAIALPAPRSTLS